MTKAELRMALRWRLADVENFSNSELDNALDLALRQTEAAAACNRKLRLFEIKAGVHTYDLSPIFEPIEIRVWIEPSAEIDESLAQK